MNPSLQENLLGNTPPPLFHTNPPTDHVPFAAEDIYAEALKQGLIKQSLGKTPDHTMASALYSDRSKKKGASLFVLPAEGFFGLREWLHPDCVLLVPLLPLPPLPHPVT
jgi:hypothetical protein